MMGTFVEVISPDERALGTVFDEIGRIENLLSKYKVDSDISRLNKAGKLKVSFDTYYLLRKAKDFWEVSGGAFDITVGTLMDIWGFTDKKFRVPAQEEIDNALKRVGFDKIIFDNANNVVEFSTPGMKIDLGGIAKGYAVDRAVKKLKASGIESCLINAGGQIYCLGKKFGKPWIVGIKDPKTNGVLGFLQPIDSAVATSGGYEQYFVKDNKRYSHILDPRTGYPAGSGILSVTVIAPDGLTADALSTAIFVLGEEKGLELIQNNFPDVKINIVNAEQ